MNLNIDLTGMFNLIMPNFKPLLYDKNRYLVLRGGAGSGKSVFCVLKIIIRILIGYKTNRKHNILVIMKTESSMPDTVVAEFKRWLQKFNILGTICQEKKKPYEFIFSNGSRIFFKGCDDPDKLLSLSGVTSIWIEEASRITHNDFIIINSRIRGKFSSYNQIMLSFNPISKLNWLYDHFYVKKQNHVTLHKSLLKDNYLLDDDIYKKEIENYKNFNINKYNTYWLGEWGSLEGVIYNNYDYVDEVPKKYNDVIYGLDFGTNVPSALIKIYEYDDEFWIEEKLYKRGMITRDIIGDMNNMFTDEDKDCPIYCDSAETDRIEEIYREGYNSQKSKKDVNAGIDFIQSKKLHILKSSHNIVKEIEGYTWMTDKKGITLEKPTKIDDHAMDAIRYAIYTHYVDKRDYHIIAPSTRL